MSYQEEALRRMEAWEKENNRQLNTLSEEEWLDVITRILPLTMDEAEAWLQSLRSQQ